MLVKYSHKKSNQNNVINFLQQKAGHIRAVIPVIQDLEDKIYEDDETLQDFVEGCLYKSLLFLVFQAGHIKAVVPVIQDLEDKIYEEDERRQDFVKGFLYKSLILLVLQAGHIKAVVPVIQDLEDKICEEDETPRLRTISGSQALTEILQ